MLESIHGPVKTYYLTPEELAERQKGRAVNLFHRKKAKRQQRQVDYRWPKARRGLSEM
ncbi:hypothetical protein SAMN05421676_11230 [Salinibacillus kushneri]|uniref:Uncharacterized protein n=1 Tax=Salinibacillus kushneri TaxID=237682 RepID=A0A1I0IDR5_9BACI|nr:hypothetical protein [Salinibacillus kushneri]SET95071.1 hypothetical protein SAMN05421676_11230 [Salinibacillus kushneri]